MFLCIYENSVSKKKKKGPVAQLNRVSDYGSEGSRFEPWRGHNSESYFINEVAFFVSNQLVIMQD